MRTVSRRPPRPLPLNRRPAREGQRPPLPVLCVGGYDPSGGAGILADLRAARAAGAEALAILGALTAQSSSRVAAVRPVPPGWVAAQIDALAAESRFGAVKTGLVAGAASIEELTAWYRRARAGPLVVDPVRTAGEGTRLTGAATWRALVRALVPLAALVTPNRLEAEELAGIPIGGPKEAEKAALAIGSLGAGAVLIKGGHLDGAPADLLWDGRAFRWLRSRRRHPGAWHGLGCHLAAAIAARLALGDQLVPAVRAARAVLARGMRGAAVSPSGRRVPAWREPSSRS